MSIQIVLPRGLVLRKNQTFTVHLISQPAEESFDPDAIAPVEELGAEAGPCGPFAACLTSSIEGRRSESICLAFSDDELGERGRFLPETHLLDRYQMAKRYEPRLH